MQAEKKLMLATLVLVLLPIAYLMLQSGTGGADPALLAIVLGSGFLDGIHPCGFAVLLFFISLLFTLRKSRGQIIIIGSSFILGVFLAYLLIGIGIVGTISLFNEPHLVAKLGAYLVILLGLLNLRDYFTGGNWFCIRIPGLSTEKQTRWIEKAALPAAIFTGFLVGLCAFPCAGGIYVAILGLLNAKATAAAGLAYLVLYNLMFVMPLIIALAFASSPAVLDRLGEYEVRYMRTMKLALGIMMIALGLVILYGGIL